MTRIKQSDWTMMLDWRIYNIVMLSSQIATKTTNYKTCEMRGGIMYLEN